MIKQFNYKGYKVNCEIYNSAYAVYQDCLKRKITDNKFEDMSIKHFDEWRGVKNYEEALDLLQHGYQPTVDKLKTQIKSNLQGEGKRISFRNDVVGYAPIVPLAIMGVPNSMINAHMKPIKAKVMDIYYDGTFNWTVKSEEIINTGAKIISQIISLEQQGYRFNLYQIQSYSDNKGSDILCTKLKDASQPIDLKRISFPMTHTSFFRVIGFDWYSKCPTAHYRSSYGHALCYEGRVNNELDTMFRQFFGNNAVYISGNQLLNEKEPEKYLKGVLTNVSIH